MLFTLLKKNFIYPVNQLPLTLMSLKEWSLVYVKGKDDKKYLQNQLTIDINLLVKNEHVLCAHCNFNGKVWSTLRIFHYKQGYAYIVRTSVVEMQIKELRKYSIFSKVTIEEEKNTFLLGVAGLNARSFLLNFFTRVPDKLSPLILEDSRIILFFSDPLERFLLILSKKDVNIFNKQKISKVLFSDSKQWLLLEIESGFPIIDKESSSKFLPQAINLENLNGINFNKGCYYGQEIIAQTYFKKLNKRFLCVLYSREIVSCKIGSIIKIKTQREWLKIGLLLAVVHIREKETQIQVVLNKYVDINSVFKVNDLKNIFFIRKKNLI
ncbi:tRNA-modifying protein YgfZ [Buchnera aphidicola (Muscaphis stroyani)]|uniref:tRNA-modifying protein YgfZ n=1 Tax=Buchnera aphidicola (Muscaphis stroyani) TaxID=1241869 RepID=A0A4D6Y4Y6_9GAMM|nr:tRNA-modifying protein YgfZ [Buchnera aphidicola]QCI24482.1 tRNA-modifying protein YgfZ [Buchnera aphidicola (Muscaphis stroyani)]